MRDGELRLAKTTAPLAFVWTWPDIDPATLNPTTVTVSRDPCGRWYVSFAAEVADPEQSPATGDVAGVDLGIKDFAVTSDGEKIPNPRKLARRACALARYQRRLARCQQGSANRIKAKAKVARAHRKVRASRADFLHRASTRLIPAVTRWGSCFTADCEAGLAVAGGNPGDACGAGVRRHGTPRPPRL